jgi:HK97 gp10 family phage protein
MAKANIKLPEEFLLRLSRLEERTDTIIPKVLEAGSAVVLAKVRGNLAAVIGRGTKYKSKSTGKLASALGISSAKLDKNGNYNVKIGFAEPRTGGGSNAKLANVLEYGKHGQPPKPFLKPAIASTRSACVEAMKVKFEEEVDGI